MMDDIYEALQKNECIDIVYIDFAKAFDSVPIDLLLDKLENIGISGNTLKFIKNFLTQRTFQVKINESFSSPVEIQSGVPQGSVLGPLLFLIFINDLPNTIPKEILGKIFADDVKLLVRHKNCQNRELLSSALLSIEKWSNENGIKISSEKTKILYIGKNNDKKRYTIADNEILESDCIRDLGILVDSKLKFSQHVNKIIKNAYFASAQILRVLKTRSLETLIFAYKTYVRPHLEYAVEVWNPHSIQNRNKIEKIQKHFTRIAMKRCGLIHRPYPERLVACNLETLENRRDITDLIMAHKIITNKTHLDPQKYFSFANRVKRKPLTIQNKRITSKTKQNFFARVVNNWNKLPKEIMEISDTKNFKNQIKPLFASK